MVPSRTAGRIIVIVLILAAVAYLPPPEEKEWLSRHGLSLARHLPSTLHVTYLKVPIFHGACITLIVMLCWQVLKSGKLLAPAKEELLLLVFMGLCAASILWAKWPRGWFFNLVPLLFGVAWAIVVARSLLRQQCQMLVLKGIVWAGLAAAAFGLAAFLFMWAQKPGLIFDPTFRLAVPHKNNANFAACILITPMLMAWRAGVGGGRHRILWALAGAMLTLCFLLTRSASGIVGAAVAVVALGALLAPPEWRVRIIALFLAFLLGAAVFILAVPGVVQRCVEFSLQGTRAVRYFFWQDAWAMLRERPLLGWGLGGFFYAYPQFRQPQEFLYPDLRKIVGDHAHSEPLTIGVELGAAGMIAACAFLAILILRAAKGQEEGESRRWRQALVAGAVGMLAQSCFSPSLRSWDVAPFFWTQIGLLMALARTNGPQNAEDRTWIQCRLPHRIGCYLAFFLALVSWLAWCQRDWRAERLLVTGFTLNVEKQETAEEAEPYLRRGASLTMNPTYWFNANRRLAVCLRAQGRLEEAISTLEDVDAEVPNLGTTRLLLGELYYARFLQAGSPIDHAKALSCLQSYAASNHDASAHLKIAKVLLRGRPLPETVLAHLEMCLRLDPENTEARKLMAEIQTRLKRKDESGG